VTVTVVFYFLDISKEKNNQAKALVLGRKVNLSPKRQQSMRDHFGFCFHNAIY
jgi:hypothetical protein